MKGTNVRNNLAKGTACLACRARKVRCSGETPVCSTCVKHWTHAGVIDRDCSPVTSRSAKGASKRDPRRPSSTSSASSGPSSPPEELLRYSTSPVTPPFSAVDETTAWTFDPFQQSSPVEDLWEYLESQESYGSDTSAQSLFDSTPYYAAPATPSLPSIHLFNPVSPLSTETLDTLFSPYQTTLDIPSVELPPPVVRPAFNFDVGMTSLARLAAVFNSSVAAATKSMEAERAKSSSLGLRTSQEALDHIFLNEPIFSMP